MKIIMYCVGFHAYNTMLPRNSNALGNKTSWKVETKGAFYNYFYRHISCETFCARKIENLVTNIAKSKYCHFYFIKTVIKYYLHFRMRKSRKFNQTKHFACKWLYSFKRLANKSWFLFLFSEFSITKRFVSNERNL